MRIEEVYVKRYGLYHDLKVEASAWQAPVTVIYGQNEAGKSTLHAFLRDMLFGFPSRSNPYLPQQGEVMGGMLTLTDDQGESFSLERYTPPKKGTLRLYTLAGEEKDERFLQHMMGNVSAEVYQQLFAFNHRQLQTLDTLHGEEVSAFLYHAAMGSGGVNLLHTEQQMKKVQDTLFKPRAVKPTMNRLLKDLEHREERLEQSGKKLDEYVPLQKQKQAEQQRLSDLKKQRRKIEQDILELQAQLEAGKARREQEQEMTRLEEEERSLRQKLESALHQLGKGWQLKQIRQLDLSIPAQDRWLQLAEQKEVRKQEEARQRQKLNEWHRELQRLQVQLEQEENEYAQRPQHTRASLASGAGEQSYPVVRGYAKPWMFMTSIAGAILVPLILLGIDQVTGAVITFLCFAYMSLQQWWKRKEMDEIERQYQERYEQEQQHRRSQYEQRKRHLLLELEEGKRQVHNEQTEQESIQAALSQTKQDLKQHISRIGLSGPEADSLLKLTQNGLSTMLHTLANVQRGLQQIENIHRDKRRLQQASLETAVTNATPTEKELQELLQQKQEEVQEVMKQIEEQASRIGQLEAEMIALETETTFSKQKQQFEEEKAHFRHLAKEWVTHRVAEHVCQTLRTYYEEQRQPSVLREAGQFMNDITFGRYTRIIAPWGEKRLLLLDQKGKRWPAEQLSQGTVEQLYLAMRFALVQEYARQVRLPVMMDDVFVHFDKERLQQVLRGVRALSATHQVLVFTCHEHVVQQFRKEIEHVHVLPLADLTTTSSPF